MHKSDFNNNKKHPFVCAGRLNGFPFKISAWSGLISEVEQSLDVAQVVERFLQR